MALEQKGIPTEQAPTMAGALEPQGQEAPPEGAPTPVGQGTFNGTISTGGEPKQVVNGKLEEGKNRLYVSNNGKIVFNDNAQILGGRTPEGLFVPIDANLLYSLSVEGT